MNWLLTILTFLPLVGVLAILFVKESEDGSNRDTIKWIAIAASAVTFAMSLFVLFRFDATNPALQLIDASTGSRHGASATSWAWTASASSWCC